MLFIIFFFSFFLFDCYLIVNKDEYIYANNLQVSNAFLYAGLLPSPFSISPTPKTLRICANPMTQHGRGKVGHVPLHPWLPVTIRYTLKKFSEWPTARNRTNNKEDVGAKSFLSHKNRGQTLTVTVGVWELGYIGWCSSISV